MVLRQCTGQKLFRSSGNLRVYLFAANFFKGAVGLWFRLCLVTGLAVCVSTYLTGVISLILALLLLLGGLSQDFIQTVAYGTNVGGGPTESLIRLVGREAITTPREDTTTQKVAAWSDLAFRWVIRRVLDFLPDVDRFSLTDYVAEGFNISATQLGLAALLLAGACAPRSETAVTATVDTVAVRAGLDSLRSRYIAAEVAASLDTFTTRPWLRSSSGSGTAAPIAREVFDFYLLGKRAVAKRRGIVDTAVAAEELEPVGELGERRGRQKDVDRGRRPVRERRDGSPREPSVDAVEAKRQIGDPVAGLRDLGLRLFETNDRRVPRGRGSIELRLDEAVDCQARIRQACTTD